MPAFARTAPDTAYLRPAKMAMHLIVLDQITRDSTSAAFELVEAIYRVDRYRFRGAFHADGSAAGTSPMLLEPRDGART